MRRALATLGLGFLLLLVQTVIWPGLFSLQTTPDLLLLLVVSLGLRQDWLPGAICSYLLGSLLDVFAGSSPGLYAMALLVVFLVVRGAARHLNTDSPLLFFFLVLCATLLQGGLLIFPLGLFADAGALWPIVLVHLIPQLMLNLLAAGLLFFVQAWLRTRPPAVLHRSGRQRLKRHYEY